MRTRVAVITGLGLAGLAGALLPSAWSPLRDKPPSAGVIARQRLPEINARLAAASSDFILTAGDSHAELLSPNSMCGLPTVNGGVGGANTKVYRSTLDEIAFVRRPTAAVLTIGTNALLAKNQPSQPANMARLVADASAIISRLAGAADRLVVTAVPPLSARVAHKFDAEGLALLSSELRHLCEARAGCTFLDPFAPLREEGRYAVARAGALADDLHLTDYQAVGRAIARHLCPAADAGHASAAP